MATNLLRILRWRQQNFKSIKPRVGEALLRWVLVRPHGLPACDTSPNIYTHTSPYKCIAKNRHATIKFLLSAKAFLSAQHQLLKTQLLREQQKLWFLRLRFLGHLSLFFPLIFRSYDAQCANIQTGKVTYTKPHSVSFSDYKYILENIWKLCEFKTHNVQSIGDVH